MGVSDVSLSSISGFSFHRLPADITAAEAVRPFNAVDRGVGALLRLAHGLAACADIQHATAVRENAPAVGFGPGVENFHALDLRRRVEPFDRRAFFVSTGVTFRRHHYGEAEVRIPAQIEILQL